MEICSMQLTRLHSIRAFLFAFVMCGAASAVGAAVPAPWLASDVGAPSPAGASSLSSGTFTITASGIDIWGTSDQFHFVYQQVSGDFEISTRVDSITNSHAWAKAGVMIRTSLAANSAAAFATVTPTSGVTFQQRTTTGATSTNIAYRSGIYAPRWLRLVRAANNITASMSAGGSQWTTLGTSTVSLGSSVYVGLAVTSHASGVVTTAKLSNVTLKAAGAVPSPQTAADIGAPALKGSTTYAGGQYTINAGGLDIWNTSDQFQYVYQPVSGDVEIIARVNGLGAAHAWSKSGVMIRETLAANSRHAYAMVSVANGYAFQRRIDTGGYSVNTSGWAGTTPVWLRLVRTGHRLDAYRSANGTTWTQMGSDTVAMASQVYVGIAVTSHNATVGTTSIVDNLTIKSSSSPNTQPPTVALTAPTAGASFTAPATITVSATASDPENRLSHVTFYAGTTQIASDTTAPFSATWSSVPAGTYSVTAVATDADGATATSTPVTVTVQGTSTNQPPTVTLTSPTSGATAAAPATFTLSATASDPEGRMARVEFYAGTTLLNSDTTAPYSFSWSAVPAGTYSVKAVAYDADGGNASSAVATVTVTGTSSTTAPRQVVFTASTDHSTMVSSYRLDVFGAGANPATATPVATSDLGKPAPATNGDITVDRATFFSALAAGNYVATVSAVGSGGTSRSTSVTFTR
jgi:regulation of enolase protein 1 (concanavalin A-like superfamily)